MSRDPSGSSPFTVLLVCTGNICRSAMADRLGRSYLDEVLGADAGLIQLISAGTRAVVGSGMHPHSALVLQGFGAEPRDFRARQLLEVDAIAADLILTMTRAHRSVVLQEAPRALARTFTLLEAADVLRQLGDDHEVAGDTFAGRARGLVRQMAAARSRRHNSDADDVPDPINRAVEVHQAVGDAIAAALIPVLARFAALGSGALSEKRGPEDAT